MRAGAADVVAAGAAEKPAPPAAGRCRGVPASSGGGGQVQGRAGWQRAARVEPVDGCEPRERDAVARGDRAEVVAPAHAQTAAARGGGGRGGGGGGGPPAGAARANRAAGIVSVVPATTWASGDRPLAAATAPAERPL